MCDQFFQRILLRAVTFELEKRGYGEGRGAAGGETGKVLLHQIVKTLESRVDACYKTRNYPTM